MCWVQLPPRPLLQGPEDERDDGRPKRDEEIERDHAGRLAPAVAQAVSLPAQGGRDPGAVYHSPG
jgi:hypothetical protein